MLRQAMSACPPLADARQFGSQAASVALSRPASCGVAKWLADDMTETYPRVGDSPEGTVGRQTDDKVPRHQVLRRLGAERFLAV